MQKLTTAERARYTTCKQAVADNLESFWKAGVALMEIRDSRLYREDFGTFKEFCEQTYQVSQSQAYRLIDAAEVVDSIKGSPIGEVVKTESQARELARAPKEKRAKVLECVSAKGPVTAKAIKAEVDSISEPPAASPSTASSAGLPTSTAGAPDCEPTPESIRVGLITVAWHRWLRRWPADELPLVRRTVAEQIRRA